MTYGQTIEWDGNRISCNGHDTREEAERLAVTLALQSGWPGPRRWWQFWRWSEPSYSHLSKYF